MSKTVICEQVGSIPWIAVYTTTKIEDAIKSLEELKTQLSHKGYRNITIKIDDDGCYESLCLDISVWGERDETPKELANRMKREKTTRERNKAKREAEKAKRHEEYLKLKKEFEPKQ